MGSVKNWKSCVHSPDVLNMPKRVILHCKIGTAMILMTSGLAPPGKRADKWCSVITIVQGG